MGLWDTIKTKATTPEESQSTSPSPSTGLWAGIKAPTTQAIRSPYVVQPKKKSFLSRLGTAFKQTGQEFVHELLPEVGKNLKDVAQAPFRAAASTMLSISHAAGKDQNIDALHPETTKAGRIIFGSQPITDIASKVVSGETAIKASPFAQKTGIAKYATPLAFAGSIGSTLLDFTGLGGAEEKAGIKAVTEIIAKSGDRLAIREALSTVKNLKPQTAEELSRVLVNVTDPKDVEKVIRQSIKAPVNSASFRASNIHPEDQKVIEDFIDHARTKAPITDSQFNSATRLMEKFGISQDKPLGSIANDFENVLNGTTKVTGTAVPGSIQNQVKEIGKYPTIHEGGKIKMVEGEPVKIIDGVDTFLHKGDGGWVVSESSTGRYLADSRTKEGAIAKAHFNITNAGEDNFKKLISENKLTPEAKGVIQGEKVAIPSESIGAKRARFSESQKKVQAEYEAGQEKIRNINKAFEVESEKGGIIKGIKTKLQPFKHTDPETKKAFEDWNAKTMQARAAANDEIGSINVPQKESWKTINAYEAGKSTPYNTEIKQTFDRLFKEAKDQGLEVPYRENYIPHVYKETPTEIDAKISKYLEDQGLAKPQIDSYLKGKPLSEETSTRLGLNRFFERERTIPTYAEAEKYGLTPKYTHPAQLAAYYKETMQKTIANKQFIEDLEKKGKILPDLEAPRDWQYINAPSFKDHAFMAPPRLAHIIDDLFQHTAPFFKPLDKGLEVAANLSKRMQEIALSAGVPKTNVNFFSIGQVIKAVTAGDFKALVPFVRANFDKSSLKYFERKAPIIRDMANEGIDLSNRLGNYQTMYKNLAKDRTITEAMGQEFDKLFNEKTFASFMPQMNIQTFEDAFKRGVKSGMPEAEAKKFAGDVTKKFFGIVDQYGRSKGTQDALSAVFFAPRFRESILNTLGNTLKSVTTNLRDPRFYKNRRLMAGMVLTYGMYNVLNKELNGNYMWDNEPNRKFALKIPRKNGEVVYLEFMPSFLAFARNIASGFINVATGDLKKAGQNFGSVLSMPVKVTTEVLANSDYFGNEIYSDNDTTAAKALKIAKYMGLQVNHPYVKEVLNQIGDPDKKKPVYQSIVAGMELPLKFSSQAKIDKNAFYDAIEKKDKERARLKEKFSTKYEDIQNLIKEGKEPEAQAMLESLTDEEYELYKSMKTSDKRRATMSGEAAMFSTAKQVQDLVAEGREDEAQEIVDNLTDEEYRLYQLAKKKL